MATKHYSTLNNDLWSKVEPLLDDYAKFYWDDEDMTNYHVFIINEKKGSLKFYNGPSFSNSYTKPQFESASSRFTGVTFNTQQISFTIAVYAVTEEDYRKLIYKFHPYTIANLGFAFQSEWRYIVKLAKREDSTRYVVGKNNKNEDLYYTELKLTFEVQGDAVAHSVTEVDYESTTEESNQECQVLFKKENTWSKSDLETPFLLTLRAYGFSYSDGNIPHINAKISYNDHDLNLFDLNLINLNNEVSLLLEYNSQTGDLCLLDGDTRRILTLLTTYTSGKRIVESLVTNKVMLPGQFDGGNWENLKIIISSESCAFDIQSTNGCGINCYARTVLI